MIQDPAFDSQEDITVDDLRKVAVKSFNDISNTIYKDWSNTPKVFVGLALSDDNSIIEKTSPVVIGEFPRHTFPANSMWNFKEKLLLRFEALDLNKFVFNESMTSNLLDSSKIDYAFIKRNGILFSEKTLTGQGFHGFSLRLFLQPISTTLTKMTLVGYPLGVEELKKAHPLYDNPVFPGILLLQMNVLLGVSTTNLITTKYGSPILPVVKISKPLDDYDQIPSSRDISVAMSRTLRSITIPETRSSLKLLLNRWEEIKEKGGSSIRQLTPNVVWPVIAEQIGK